ncbi:unnamed protein product [Rhizophagus irregularis]|nr:unnamed protein product [Rhizophagus irregularis]
MTSETLINSLLQDLNKLYNEADDYDVIIKAGEGSNSEDFKAHSNILRIRSTYFKAALSSNWTRKEGNVTIFKKPNIKADTFKIILKYIYTGIINLDTSITGIGELLIAADEINLVELISYIQNHIVKLKKEWSEKDIIKLFNILSCRQEVFNTLYVYFRDIISNNPGRFFNESNLFIELENDAFLSLIQNDDFDMEEIEIWNNLLKWAISKNSTISSNTTLWKTEEMELEWFRVKNKGKAIYDCINNSHSFGEYDLEIFKRKCRNGDYETKISEDGDFELEDYEVFQVNKKE